MQMFFQLLLLLDSWNRCDFCFGLMHNLLRKVETTHTHTHNGHFENKIEIQMTPFSF